MATHPDGLQSLRRFHLSFADTEWEDSLHPFGRQGNTIQMSRSLIRKLLAYDLHPSRHSPYYDNYVQTSCNRLNSKATPSRSSLNKKTRDAHYGKVVAQLTVRILYASVQTPPREIRDRFDLGLLSL